MSSSLDQHLTVFVCLTMQAHSANTRALPAETFLLLSNLKCLWKPEILYLLFLTKSLWRLAGAGQCFYTQAKLC